jgi:hypothetical protein
VHDAGVDAYGSGGDPALADAVVAEIEAADGTAVASYENLETAAIQERWAEIEGAVA